MRKLASIQLIEEIKPIDKADAIEAARINGWWSVVKKGEYAVGNKVIFCEVDSFVPTEIAPFLTKTGHEAKTHQGVTGERLRTVKLRGQLSQGLILPISIMGDEFYKDRSNRGLKNCWVKTVGSSTRGATDEVGADVSQYLGIIKYELQELKQADAKGTFPVFIPKTDQERIQNCYKEVAEAFKTDSWFVEEKVEGQSSTIYFNQGEFGVASRNLELKDSDNTFWNTARKYNLPEKLVSLGRNIAIQSEQCGPGISGNVYGFTEYLLFVFDIFDIDKQEYFDVKERNEIAKQLGLTVVPYLFTYTNQPINLDQILDLADGKSVLGNTGTLREGLVWRKIGEQRCTFKSVSNKYLLNEK